MRRRPPRSTTTDPPCPYTPRVRSPARRARPRKAAPTAPPDGRDRHWSGRRYRRGGRLPPSPPSRRESVSAAPFRYGKSRRARSEEHTSELQSLMRISYAVFCLKKKNRHNNQHDQNSTTTFT